MANYILYNYLGGTPNINGTWSIATGSCIGCPNVTGTGASANINIDQTYVDNLLAPCTCIYTYTVDNGGGCTDTATVTFNLNPGDCNSTITLLDYDTVPYAFSVVPLLIDNVEPTNYVYKVVARTSGESTCTDPAILWGYKGLPCDSYLGENDLLPNTVPMFDIATDVIIPPGENIPNNQFFIGAGEFDVYVMCVDGIETCIKKECCSIEITTSAINACVDTTPITVIRAGDYEQILDYEVLCDNTSDSKCVKFITDGYSTINDDFKFEVYSSGTWVTISTDVDESNVTTNTRQAVINIQNNSVLLDHPQPTIELIPCVDGKKTIRVKISSTSLLPVINTNWSVTPSCCDCLDDCPVEKFPCVTAKNVILTTNTCGGNLCYDTIQYNVSPAHTLVELQTYTNCLNFKNETKTGLFATDNANFPAYSQAQINNIQLTTTCLGSSYTYEIPGNLEIIRTPVSPGFEDISLVFGDSSLYTDSATLLGGLLKTNQYIEIRNLKLSCSDTAVNTSLLLIIDGITITPNGTDTITFQNIPVNSCDIVTNGWGSCNFIPLAGIYVAKLNNYLIEVKTISETNIVNFYYGNGNISYYCKEFDLRYSLIMTLPANDINYQESWVLVLTSGFSNPYINKIIQKGTQANMAAAVLSSFNYTAHANMTTNYNNCFPG